MGGGPIRLTRWPGSVGNRFGAVPETQFCEQIADMMGGGLAADEQALCDLGIRKSEADKVKHFLLAPGQRAGVPRSGSAKHSEGP
jgi:hypothetical protein